MKEDLLQITGRRYAERPREYRARNRVYLSQQTIDEMDARTFRAYFRMDRTSFKALLDAIRGNLIFHNISTNRQRPVELQLYVAMHFFGSNGTGRLYTAGFFQIAEGTVYKYIHRVTRAVLSLQHNLIRWPAFDSPEYRQTVHMMRYRFGFPNCIGSVDGSTIPLYSKPRVQGERYYDRKSNHSLNATAIVDGEARINFLVVGRNLSHHQAVF